MSTIDLSQDTFTLTTLKPGTNSVRILGEGPHHIQLSTGPDLLQWFAAGDAFLYGFEATDQLFFNNLGRPEITDVKLRPDKTGIDITVAVRGGKTNTVSIFTTDDHAVTTEMFVFRNNGQSNLATGVNFDFSGTEWAGIPDLPTPVPAPAAGVALLTAIAVLATIRRMRK